MKLRAVVAVLGAFGRGPALHEHGLEPRSALRRRDDFRLPALSF
jgi:hypothetical protein